MKEKSKTLLITDVLLILFSAALLAGLLTVLRPCAAKDDGSWMTCHWAGQALLGVAGAMLLLSVIRLLGKNGFRNGTDAALILLALLAASIPGHLVSLCMMPTMRCRSTMTPCTLVLSCLTALAAAIDLFLRNRKGSSL